MTDPLDGRTATLGEKKNDLRGHTSGNGESSAEQASTKEKNVASVGYQAAVASDSEPGASPKTKSRRRRRRRNRAGSDHVAAEQGSSNDVSTNNNSKSVDGQNSYAKGQGTHNARHAPRPQPDGRHHAQHQAKNRKHPHKRPHNSRQPLYAALDLGTNNCRLLIAKPTRAGQFHVVDAFSRIVRLGEGLGRHGELSQDAMDRAVGALKICASKLSRHQIKNYRLIATEACRQAANGQEFLERVKRDTGLNLEMINRETEARLAVSGCASLVGRNTNSVILFDIGGGSSEIAAIQFDGKRTARLANHITAWTSLPVGVVTLSERHGGRDVTPEIFDQMVEEVDQLLDQMAPEDLLGFKPDIENFHLLGTSGTVTTLAGLHLNLARYDRRRVDGLWLQDQDVDNMLNKLLSWDLQTRSANPCIGPDRSDLVLAGCAIMQSIRKRWPSTRMRVADRGLREGLLNDMMAKDGVWRRRKRRKHNHNRSSAKIAESMKD